MIAEMHLPSWVM